jgi:putative two-component system response regulator
MPTQTRHPRAPSTNGAAHGHKPSRAPAVDVASPQSLLPLLVVDDEEGVRRAFAGILTHAHYSVDTAASGEDAIAALSREQFSVVLCDVRMPGLDGFAVMRHAREVDPEVALIVVSAVDDAATATTALRAGASDYLTKPVDRAVLEAAVARALSEREAAQQRTTVAIREAVAARTAALEHEKTALRAMNVSMAEALVRAMEAKDTFLRGHSQRMAALAADIATTMGLEPDIVDAVRLAARLADVGKIGTRETVLHKPGALTPDEYDHVQDHVRIGLEILSPLEHLGPVLEYVRDHHEHFDGTGYPRAVEGNSISIGGRILSAADAFVALTSRRSYRDPLSTSEALRHLRLYVGRLLDPAVFAALKVVAARQDKGESRQ